MFHSFSDKRILLLMVLVISFGGVVQGQSANNLMNAITETHYHPLADPQILNINALQPFTIMLTGYSANGRTLTFNIAAQPAQGALGTLNQSTGEVLYSPSGSQSGSDSFTFYVSDGIEQSQPETVVVNYVPPAPAVSLSPSSLSFNNEIVGTSSSSKGVTLQNTGNTTLMISGIAATKNFAETDNCGSSVAAGSGCMINVTFSPSAAGPISGTLSVDDNGSNSPQTVQLSGIGEDFGLSVTSGTPSSATVTVGSSASYSLSIAPEGGFNQAISLACTGAPSKATCSISPSSVTLDGSNAATVKVNVTTATSSLVMPQVPSRPVAPFLPLGIVFLGIAGLAFVHIKPRKVGARAELLALLGLLLMSVALWTSCGGGGVGGSNTGTTPGTPTGTYTLTVTGVSGSLKHATTINLTVK